MKPTFTLAAVVASAIAFAGAAVAGVGYGPKTYTGTLSGNGLTLNVTVSNFDLTHMERGGNFILPAMRGNVVLGNTQCSFTLENPSKVTPNSSADYKLSPIYTVQDASICQATTVVLAAQESTFTVQLPTPTPDIPMSVTWITLTGKRYFGTLWPKK